MRCFGYLFVVIGLCGACAENALGALITLDQSTTLDASNTNGLDNYMVVQGANPPTVVDILPGAKLVWDQMSPTLDVYHASVVNVRENYNTDGGYPRFRFHDSAQLNVYGGDLLGFGVEMRDRSSTTMYAGFADGVRAYDDAYLRVSAGYIGNTYAYDNSKVDFLDGTTEGLSGEDAARVNLLGGVILFGAGFSGKTRVLADGTKNLDGVYMTEESVLVWKGGNIGPDGGLYVYDNAVAHVYGYGIHFYADEFGRELIGGRLADGTQLESTYYVRDNGRIILHEVPEPTSIALCFVTGLGLAFVHWRDRPWRFYQRFTS